MGPRGGEFGGGVGHVEKRYLESEVWRDVRVGSREVLEGVVDRYVSSVKMIGDDWLRSSLLLLLLLFESLFGLSPLFVVCIPLSPFLSPFLSFFLSIVSSTESKTNVI